MARVVFQPTLWPTDAKRNVGTKVCGFSTYFRNRGEVEFFGAEKGQGSGPKRPKVFKYTAWIAKANVQF